MLLAVGGLLALCVLLGAGIFVVRLVTHRSLRPAGLVRSVLVGTHHGAVGTIQSIDPVSETITLQLLDGTTQVVLANGQTQIEKGRKKASFAGLAVGDRLTVIGSPDDQGRIVARWIRVFNSSGSASLGDRPGPRRARTAPAIVNAQNKFEEKIS